MKIQSFGDFLFYFERLISDFKNVKNGIFEPNVVFFVSVIHSGSFYTKKIYTKGTDATFFAPAMPT